ncbi:hypothetical protein HN51_019173 [Arachis hypogaea]|nr:Zinc finger protein JACKDAW [Arachis hypogaea]QHO30838.1 Zinc finger protein JACKDAW [Arachis hypogaea]
MMMMSSSEAFSSSPSAAAPSSSSIIHYGNPNSIPGVAKRKRSQPGRPDPEAEVIALSPKSLMATNRFVCEICKKGFQRDQNLQLHRRGHNLPWKLRQREKEEVVRKKVYVCPEKSCVHHESCRALGDLTGIKKHYSRKHGEKKLKCEKCSKKYAVHSDWKAHTKICGTREYRCHCGTLFSRKDSFLTHRSFCQALPQFHTASMPPPSLPLWLDQTINQENKVGDLLYSSSSSTLMSATALLQKATQMESTPMASNNDNAFVGFMLSSSSQFSSFNNDSNLMQHPLGLTRDFLGVGVTTKFMTNPMGSLLDFQTNPLHHHQEYM